MKRCIDPATDHPLPPAARPPDCPGGGCGRKGGDPHLLSSSIYGISWDFMAGQEKPVFSRVLTNESAYLHRLEKALESATKMQSLRQIDQTTVTNSRNVPLMFCIANPEHQTLNGPQTMPELGLAWEIMGQIGAGPNYPRAPGTFQAFPIHTIYRAMTPNATQYPRLGTTGRII